MARFHKLTLLVALALIPTLLTGCYTRLTTAKETREWRETYPELEDGQIIERLNARENLGNTFIMPVETYLDAVQRFQQETDSNVTTTTGEVYRFRPGNRIQIDLPGHEDPSIERQYVITPEGTIDVGPILDLPVAGFTRHEIRDELSTRLLRYMKPLIDPDSGRIRVSISIPIVKDAGTFSVEFGHANILSLSGSSSTSVRLTGDDTLLSVLAKSNAYSTNSAWKELAIFRKVRTRQMTANGKPLEYTIVIVCDLEEILYENQNLDLRVQSGDLIYIHPEKAPWIVEIFNTMRVITDVYSAFQGVEGVMEDIFNTNF
ncbi:MAG: polysaccharide biosynthesis/export family protein [Planctomycetes bacterium]|nr:polysaccharide biosynthesis/export family protein [Planctomycetota bacterium]